MSTYINDLYEKIKTGGETIKDKFIQTMTKEIREQAKEEVKNIGILLGGTFIIMYIIAKS